MAVLAELTVLGLSALHALFEANWSLTERFLLRPRLLTGGRVETKRGLSH